MLDTNHSMNAVIMGCGRMGAWLAVELSERGYRVCILDMNEENFRRLPVSFRAAKDNGESHVAVVGDGTQQEDLILAGIEQADVFIATMERDPPNLLAAQIAQHIFRVPRVVCRMNDLERQEVYEQLGLRVVNVTLLLGERLLDVSGEL